MDTVRSLFFKPTPEEQKRKCNALVRSNMRKLDRDIDQLKQLEFKTKKEIIAASKRGQRNQTYAKQAAQDTRVLARGLLQVRRQTARLSTSKAQLQSVQMQVSEAFAVRKIEGSIKASTGIMKDVNSLVRLPELTGTMRELSQELIKAGIINEMVGDSMPETEDIGEDEEAETEVDKVLAEVLKDRLPAAAERPEEELPAPVAGEVEAEEEEDQAKVLEAMRGRLEALKS